MQDQSPHRWLCQNADVDAQQIWDQVWQRLEQTATADALTDQRWVLAGCVLGVVLVLTPAWRLARVPVTVVHELGHAGVGILCGRRFTGFVVNPDMSGHTVTRGRPRGPALVATTAAGYPAPVVTGAVLVVSVGAGHSDLVLLVALVACLFGLVRARSLYTAVVMVILVGAIAALWWTGAAEPGAAVVTSVGVLLMVGGWRQLVNVARHGDRAQDPGMLTVMTRVPAPVWVLVFTAVGAAATWWAVPTLVEAVHAVLA